MLTSGQISLVLRLEEKDRNQTDKVLCMNLMMSDEQFHGEMKLFSIINSKSCLVIVSWLLVMQVTCFHHVRCIVRGVVGVAYRGMKSPHFFEQINYVFLT